jgi:CubicO group peptidase (beta-lactamase class C family)
VSASVDTTMRRLEKQLIETTSGTGLLERMAHHAVPGVGLAVIANGAIAFEGSYGVKEAGRPGPVTATTRFQACSISKPVAVLGMLRLVERGVIDLDADVNDLLTSWQIPPNASWQPRVTLRQIASHSAGLTVSGFPGYAAGEPLPTLTQILTGSAPANTPGVRVDTFPGVQFRYAGGGTTVLQQVLEDVIDRPFRELMRELVIDPLGMSSSDYAQPLPRELQAEAATAHRSDGTAVPGGWHVYPELAAAGLWTTPGDLARYAIAVQRSYHGVPDAILGAELAAQMLTRQIDSSARMGGLESLGLGLFLGGRPEPKTFGHSGGNEGFKCHLLAHRDAGWGAVVMTNGDGGHALVQEILNALGRELEWPDYEQAEPPADAEPGSTLDPLTGVYELRPGATVAVSRGGDELRVRALGQPEARFVQVSETEFGSFAVDATLSFTRSADEHATELILRQNGEELVCRRVDGDARRSTI